MRNRVCEMVERPSVRLSIPSISSSSGRFAAECPAAEDIDQWQTRALSSNGAAARRSAANTDKLEMRLNTHLFLYNPGVVSLVRI